MDNPQNAPASAPTASSPKPRRRLKLSKTTVFVAVVVLLAAAVGVLAWQNFQLRAPEAQQEIARKANEALVKEVGQIILLPDETPNVASIVDVDALRKANQEFYKDAANGDTLLIYSTKAIIYRKSEGRIVNVAPVKLTPAEQPKEE